MRPTADHTAQRENSLAGGPSAQRGREGLPNIERSLRAAHWRLIRVVPGIDSKLGNPSWHRSPVGVRQYATHSTSAAIPVELPRIAL